MNDLIDIHKQIEKLQKQANEIKAREFDRTVHEIVAKMKAFGISAKDLQVAGSARSGSGSAAAGKRLRVGGKKKTTVAVAPKYRGPGGETWSGRGLTPKWLAALVAAGGKKEDFVIHS